MRIVFLALPLSGHLNPQIELAKSCVEHDCIFINTTSRKELILSNGFTFYPMGDRYAKDIDLFSKTSDKSRISLLRTVNAFRQLGQLFDVIYSETVNYLKDLKPDLVVVDFSTVWGGYAAEALGIPFVTTNSSPMVNDTTNEWKDVPFLMGWSKGNSLKNKLGWFFIRSLQKVFNYPYEWFRWYREDGSLANYSNQMIFNLGMKELEFNQHQVAWTRWIGYPSGSKDYQDVPLPDGYEKKVLITLGTLLAEVLEKEVKPVIQQLAKRNPDTLFVMTYGSVDRGMELTGQDNCYEIGYLPYGLNVKKFDVVIHHGGPGVIFECIEHAIPSIVLPQSWDQFDYAKRLDYYGAAQYCKSLKDLEKIFKQLEDWDKSRLEKLSRIYQSYDAGQMFKEQIETLMRKESGDA